MIGVHNAHLTASTVKPVTSEKIQYINIHTFSIHQSSNVKVNSDVHVEIAFLDAES